MKFIVIPDSFKGSMSSVEAAAAIERGLKSVHKDASVICLPAADGGEGTIEVFRNIGIGRMIEKEVTGPLGGRIPAKYILTEDKTAIIEMAQGSGLTLINRFERNPMKTTSFGTGELIADAVSRGAKKILLAIGGSATNDGGLGMAQALGASFTDTQGKEVRYSCEGLGDLHNIDEGKMRALLQGIEIVIACDVQNTLCGPEGASAVYGPQKGADHKMVQEMDRLLNKLAGVIQVKTGIDMRTIKGTGAAGGIAVTLIAFAGAKLVSGIEVILEYIGFEKHLDGADYVLTGEGRIDEQTRYGKVIAGILNASKKKGVPVIAFAGMLGSGYEQIMEAGVKSCFCILPGVVTIEDAVKNGPTYLEDCVRRVARLL